MPGGAIQYTALMNARSMLTRVTVAPPRLASFWSASVRFIHSAAYLRWLSGGNWCIRVRSVTV
jgi:hypothetical protein